jgi:protein gp37
MAENTGISWTDSTFNPWWGCSKVGPGCDNCYAEALSASMGGDFWGPDKTPRTMSSENWRRPRQWERDHEKFEAIRGHRRRVFSGSMCDWADKNAPEGQRERLFELIRNTPNLDWQLLTKRAPNIRKYLPDDWEAGYKNVWLGVTVENRQHGFPRIDQLRDIPAVCRFLSIEPLLEDLGEIDLSGIDWVIVGGESGPFARPMNLDWVLSIKEQCDKLSKPFFYKQFGGVDDKGSSQINGIEYKAYPIVRI